MPCFIQPVDYLIRFGPEARKYGDPYDGTVAVVRRGMEAELVGYAPTAGLHDGSKQYLREIFAELARNGFTVAIIRRIKGGKCTTARFDLTARSRKPDLSSLENAAVSTSETQTQS